MGAPALAEVLGAGAAAAGTPEDLPSFVHQAARTGFCAHPVRLVGELNEATVNTTTGEVRSARQVYSTADEPGRVLLKACGNRRTARCPACGEVYRRDAYQLVRAGLAGGKGIPATVAEHPRLFVTFTAPSFGPVHTRRERGGKARACRPRDPAKRCPHGRPAACHRRHSPEDPLLGQPLCPDCFDYQAAVLWNAVCPELWRRTTDYTRRHLARLAGLSLAELKQTVRVSFTKVAEYQLRGLIHFHAVIRLDATPPADQPDATLSPPAMFTAELLAAAIRQAAAAVTAPLPAVGEQPERRARWGSQLDIREITGTTGQTSAEQVAGYVAKYATKGTESFGSALDRRLTSRDLDRLDVSPHIARLVQACWRLGADPALARFRLRQWAHMLGFGGHWTTKSRRYSTTMGALRRARAEHTARQHGDVRYLDAGIDEDGEQATVVLGRWRYAGSGYHTVQQAQLAAAIAAFTREQRRAARTAATTIA